MPKKKPIEPVTYIDWRNRVLEKNLYTCQVCKKDHHQVTLEAHHVRHYYSNPTLRLKVENGITLCDNCHKKQHKKGWKNG